MGPRTLATRLMRHLRTTGEQWACPAWPSCRPLLAQRARGGGHPIDVLAGEAWLLISGRRRGARAQGLGTAGEHAREGRERATALGLQSAFARRQSARLDARRAAGQLLCGALLYLRRALGDRCVGAPGADVAARCVVVAACRRELSGGFIDAHDRRCRRDTRGPARRLGARADDECEGRQAGCSIATYWVHATDVACAEPAIESSSRRFRRRATLHVQEILPATRKLSASG